MWVTKANLIVYCSHFLSSWGNRMWMFALSIFLVRIADDNIQLSATYGLASGLAVFFFGAILGDWVDNTPRLKAALVSLTLQYLLMLGCSAVVAVYLHLQQPIQDSHHDWLSPVLRAVIVCLGVLSEMAAQTRVLVVERDWVVEICALDSDHLASMTAMLRRLDLLTMVLAPLAMGQVMEHLGQLRGALFMIGWVLVSLLVQLFLTWKVYKIVPALKNQKRSRHSEADPDRDHLMKDTKTPAINIIKNNDNEHENNIATTDTNGETTTLTSETLDKDNNEKSVENQHENMPTETVAEVVKSSNGVDCAGNGKGDTGHAHSDTEHAHDTEAVEAGRNADGEGSCVARASKIGVLHQLVTLYRGGKVYVSYTVALPGLALACLYLTVLSFDNITVAYIVTQGLTESAVGITMSSSAVFGVISTFAYTFIRRRIGVVRTGFLGVFCEVSVLTLCVASIWMPGSPFDPWYENSAQGAGQAVQCLGQKDVMNLDFALKNTTRTSANFMDSSAFIENIPNNSTVNSVDNSISTLSSSSRSSSNNITFSTGKNDTCRDGMGNEGPSSYVSVGFFLAGIFLARFGVWMADLAITQLFLEKVVSAERGIVNGVQSSLNQLMNLLKFALVVALPDMETFGFHILITFCAIGTANLLYFVYVRREKVALCSGGCGSPAERDRPSRKELSLEGGDCSL